MSLKVVLTFVVLFLLSACSTTKEYQSAEISEACQDYNDPQERESCYFLNIRYSIHQKLTNEPFLSYPKYGRYDLILEASLNEFGQVQYVEVIEHSGDTYKQDLIADAIVEESPFIFMEDESIRSIVYACYYNMPICEIDKSYVLLGALD